MSKGRWYWYSCAACPEAGIRYRNVKKCQRCGKAVKRLRQATDQEMAAQIARVEAWRKWIPE